MNETTYPAWQQSIREAQAKQAAEDAKLLAEERIKLVEKEKVDGLNLATVLDEVYGITIEPPAKNEVVLDGFRFWLSQNANWRFLRHANGALQFRLYVNVIAPDDWDPEDAWVSAQDFNCSDDYKWLQIQLADALDQLDMMAASLIEQKKSRIAAALKRRTEPKRLTLDEQIQQLVKAAVEKAMDEVGEF